MDYMQSERDEINKVIARRVEHERRHARVSQRELAERLGMALGPVSQRLLGHRPWRAAELVQVAALLDVPLSGLFRGVVEDLLAKEDVNLGDPG